MLIFGGFATVRHRGAIYLVVVLTALTLRLDLVTQASKSSGVGALDTALRMVCISIMFCVTLMRTLRRRRINGYRGLGGIAGYLLIGRRRR